MYFFFHFKMYIRAENSANSRLNSGFKEMLHSL